MTIEARSWSAVIDDGSTDFTAIYDKAIALVASDQANEKLDELEKEGSEIPDTLRPIYDDPGELIQEVIGGTKPSWWPQKLNRVQLKVSFQPEGMTKETLSPHVIDPNRKDLGRKLFSNLLRSKLDSQGVPFEGRVIIQVLSKHNRSLLSSWKGNIYINEKQRKGRRRSGGLSDDDERLEMWKEEAHRSQDAMHKMFANSSNVIHASASVINASRGVNAPAPWQMGGDEGEPMWLALVNGAMQMAANSGLLGNNNANPAQSMGQIMQTPVQGPGAIGQYGQPAQLPGPVGQQNAYNQYQQVQGDYDGYSVHEDDLLDDGLGEDPYEDYIDEDGYEYEYEDDEFEYEYEEPDEVERGGRRGNPLDGKSPEEIQAYLNEYIDKNPDKKGQLKQLGMGLATKLLG